MSAYSMALELLKTVDSKIERRASLERIKKIAGLFGNPQFKPIVVQVTGSNGKGSVCAFTASILQKAGFKTGLYTSPYIFKPTEKIKINGKEISEEEYGNLILEVNLTAEKAGVRLSYSEHNALAAFLHFARSNCGFAVIEVKAGGLLDATNICNAKLAVITNIELEHQKILGKTKREIAAQKAGIIKQASIVITAEKSLGILELLREECKRKNAKLVEVKKGSDFELGLKGEFQKINAACAVEAARALGIKEEFIKEGLKNAEWPGRFQILQEKPLLLVDSAHNPTGMKELVKALSMEFPERKFVFVVAFTKGRNFRKMLELIAPLAERFVVGRSDSKRAIAEEKIMKEAGKLAGVEKFNGLQGLKNKDVVVCGSIFFIPKALEGIKGFGSLKTTEAIAEFV